jgi:hypothetical protein
MCPLMEPEETEPEEMEPEENHHQNGHEARDLAPC